MVRRFYLSTSRMRANELMMLLPELLAFPTWGSLCPLFHLSSSLPAASPIACWWLAGWPIHVFID